MGRVGVDARAVVNYVSLRQRFRRNPGGGAMLTSSAQGVYAIAPTPFHEDGRIDDASTDRMIDFYRDVGCTGITLLGIMGEAPKLDHVEALALVDRAIRRAGIPIVVGVSAPGFAAMRSLARSAMDAGAAGVMIAPPQSLRTDDQIVAYFAQAAEAVGTDVPFVLQDYPLTLGVIHDAGRDPAHRNGKSILRHAEARRLAGAREDLHAAPISGGRDAAAPVDPVRQRRTLP
jgi:hypothetical protein